MEHQVEQLRAGTAPDDLIDPERLDSAHAIGSLKEAFRAVARIQRGVGQQLELDKW